jgi:alkylation response protein AidB-like acyl-CoA dehydrogenase
MSFEPKILFPGMLADSAARLAQDAASKPLQPLSSSIIAEMGWGAVLVAESQGGVGGGFADLASIIEGLASNAVDLPVITRCGIVPSMLAALPDGSPDASPVHARARQLLRDIAEGAAVVELGGPLSAGESARPLTARRGPQGWHVSGTTAEMTLTEDCSHVLLVCTHPGDGNAGKGSRGEGEVGQDNTGKGNTDNRNTGNGAPILVCVDASKLHGHMVGYRTMDDRRVLACQLEHLAIDADSVLATGPDAERAIQAGWRVAVAAMATDTVCAMGSALARTIRYLLERQQFGQPLAQFQALRHEVARLYVSYEINHHLLQASLRSLTTEQSTAAQEKSSEKTNTNEADAAALALLGLYSGQEAIKFAESVIQLHGGMGMTREMPAAQLATRLMANAFRFGDPLAYRHSLHDLRTRMPS